MKHAVLVLAAFAALASLIPFIRKEAWWIRVFDFPRVQILCVALLALALGPFLWDPGTVAGAAVLFTAFIAIVIQALCIFPYTRLAPFEVLTATEENQERTFSLLVANVLMTNLQTAGLLGLIRKYAPDVVLLLEPDAYWYEKMQVLEDEGYRYTVKEPLGNKYGMLLFSRLELIDPVIKHLLKPGIPSMHTRVRLRSGDIIWFHGVHPEPPSPTEADSSLPRDAELLIVGREAKEHPLPAIVAGDLNDVAWSYTTRLFQKISSLLDPRKGRGMFNTYHAKIPLMRWPLDHVFHSEHFVVCDMQRLPTFCSDHFPVYVRLQLQPGAEAVQEAPVPDQEDHEAAEEKIEKGDKESKKE
jgi:endonuclease/exonuclease/phosphatase (EEP) superfamily protein YafD